MIKVGAEREVSFDRAFRTERQANYNINDYDLTSFEFADGERKIYKNFNFSIFIDDYCNADCKFCIAQIRYQHRKAMYKKDHIKNTDEYLTRLKEVLKFIRPLNPSISITGGEPSMSPILTDVMEIVDRLGFRKRTITSNGSGLFIKQNGDTILNNLKKYHWDHLNISRTSWDDNVNKRIMRYDDEKQYCDSNMIKDILQEINGTDLHHRFSCLLLKESVNSVDNIARYIEFYDKLGANNFIFRQLMDYDKSAINKEKMEYCTGNKIDLNDIWTQLDKDDRFKPYMNILGYYYYVEIYKYGNNTIASESANLSQQYVEKNKHKDTIYEMVFHNNGNLCASWLDTEDVLSKYRGVE